MIHLILGRQGSGKTLFMAKLAYKAYQYKKQIHSNIHFNFPFHQLDYKDIIECNLKDCYVFIDEVHLLLPARLSLRKINIEICDNFLSMARKQNTEIFGTTQTMRKVDVRFREEADYIYKLKKYAWINRVWNEVKHNISFPKSTPVMVECDMFRVDQDIPEKVSSLRFMANEFYSLYDTYQIVKVKNLPEPKR